MTVPEPSASGAEHVWQPAEASRPVYPRMRKDATRPSERFDAGTSCAARAPLLGALASAALLGRLGAASRALLASASLFLLG